MRSRYRSPTAACGRSTIPTIGTSAVLTAPRTPFATSSGGKIDGFIREGIAGRIKHYQTRGQRIRAAPAVVRRT